MSEVIALRAQLDYTYVINILWQNLSQESVKHLRKLPSPARQEAAGSGRVTPESARRFVREGVWMLASRAAGKTGLQKIAEEVVYHNCLFFFFAEKRAVPCHPPPAICPGPGLQQDKLPLAVWALAGKGVPR